MSNRPVAKGGGGGKKPTYGYAPTPIGPDDGGITGRAAVASTAGSRSSI